MPSTKEGMQHISLTRMPGNACIVELLKLYQLVISAPGMHCDEADQTHQA